MLHTVTLNNRRVVSYQSYGDPNEKVLFIAHGLNGSRLEAKTINSLLRRKDIRVIGVDRAGMGHSSFQENRTFLDFTDDIVKIANKLHIDKFSILGISAGAGYALACAYKIPDRLTSVHVISGLGPSDLVYEDMNKESRSFIALAKKFPRAVKPLFWLLIGRFSQDDKKSDKFLGNIMQSLGDVDKNIFKDEKLKQLFLNSCREAYRQGTKGVAYDAILAYTKDWGFELKEIKFDNIYFYHGKLDLSLPVLMAEKMSKITNAKLKIYPNDGHLSIIVNQIKDIEIDFFR